VTGRCEIILERRARKNLAALDPPARRRVAARIDELAAEPRPLDMVEVKGRPGVLRIRAGDYRILYKVGDQQLLVLVLVTDIGHRREIYR
jgi:mRNA interferase RelE/StbE